MKISKKAINAICIVCEVICIGLIALFAYLFHETQGYSAHTVITYMLLLAVGGFILDLLFLCATVTVHIITMRPGREQAAHRKRAQKQKRIEHLQAKLDNLKEDGE